MATNPKMTAMMAAKKRIKDIDAQINALREKREATSREYRALEAEMRAEALEVEAKTIRTQG